MIKQYRKNTSGRRGMTSQDFTMITCREPEKSLTFGLKRNAGRDSQGRISVRHRGGGHKRRYRILTFKREFNSAKVISIEYDPNRKARIALIEKDGQKQYIIAPEGLKVGQNVYCDEKAPIEVGNRLPLKNIPVGTLIHDIEIAPKSKGKICRSAGSSAILLAIEDKYAMIKLPSGEIRQFLVNCQATIGQVGNVSHNLIKWGKAGRIRHLGRRPTVRGKAMYPEAHPHGGGEGGSPIGMKSPKTPWGARALGIKTRKANAPSNFLIIRRRKKRK